MAGWCCSTRTSRSTNPRATITNPGPRELLVKVRERNKLLGLVRREGMTLVPLALYFNSKGIAKLQLGLAKGRKKQDKRQAAKDRDWSRDKARLLRSKG